MADKHTRGELQQYQSLPLSAKIEMTQQRISAWVDHYGIDGVYVSFSGGKDSTVLLHIVRQMYPEAKAVFFDTGLEFPEIRKFVKNFPNVEWVRPDMSFKEVVEKRGYPFIGKEVAEQVGVAKNAIEKMVTFGLLEKKEGDTRTYAEIYREKMKDEDFARKVQSIEGIRSLNALTGFLIDPKTGKTSPFNRTRFEFMLDAPFKITAQCCYVMKKKPAHTYARKSGRMPITGQMASDSRIRLRQWMENGCNGFDMVQPISNPMAFWTEQDVLTYIRVYGDQMVDERKRAYIAEHPEKTPMELLDEFSGPEWKPICSVYGDVVTTLRKKDQDGWEDQSLNETDRPRLKTTGQSRTGCCFCGFGCHLAKEGEGHFEILRKTHPKQYEFIMKPQEEGGLGFKAAIDWMNEHGRLHIRY